MHVLLDIETSDLSGETLWLIVCKDVSSGAVYEFYGDTLPLFTEFHQKVTQYVGHNIIDFDFPVLQKHFPDLQEPKDGLYDTLVVSRLLKFSLDGGHSLEAWGERLGCKKVDFNDFSKFSQEMLAYCRQDVEVTHKLYDFQERFRNDPSWQEAFQTEHRAAYICRDMHRTGFCFDLDGARALHSELTALLAELDKRILDGFKPKVKFIREVTPRETKSGALNANDFRWIVPNERGCRDLSAFAPGVPFSLIEYVPFNPGSPRQMVERLNDLGWKPYEKTKTHIEVERELRAAKRFRKADVPALQSRLESLERLGWRVSENNLATLPSPEPIKRWMDKSHILIQNHEPLISALTIKQILKKSGLTLENITTNTQIALASVNSKESMELLATILIEWRLPRNIVAEFVNKENHLWSIIVTPQEVYVDCSASFVTDTWASLKNTTVQQKLILELQTGAALAQRLTASARLSDLEEWMGQYNENTGRIHGSFFPTGSWTGRMAHRLPNTGNIASEFDPGNEQKSYTPVEQIKKHFDGRMRSLYRVPDGCLQVGIDMDAAHLRILAHLIDEPEFTKSIISGNKKDKTDIHSVNQRLLGEICRTRDEAKIFIYLWLNGGGAAKLAAELRWPLAGARDALARYSSSLDGLQRLLREDIPRDAARGYFVGIDGRKVAYDKEHGMLAGYLQSAESIILKRTAWRGREECIRRGYDVKLLNLVHDEIQTEVRSTDRAIAEEVGQIFADGYKDAAAHYRLRCPFAGGVSIGTNWQNSH